MKKSDIVTLAKKYKIQTNVEKRWESGIHHHPKSEELARALGKIDYEFCDSYFDWQFGGDGDSEEELMYALDIYFEVLDKINK